MKSKRQSLLSKLASPRTIYGVGEVSIVDGRLNVWNLNYKTKLTQILKVVRLYTDNDHQLPQGTTMV